MQAFGKYLIILGLISVVFGVILLNAHRFPWLGRLPGDIVIEKKNFSFYFPITTSIIVSVIISVILFIFSKK